MAGSRVEGTDGIQPEVGLTHDPGHPVAILGGHRGVGLVGGCTPQGYGLCQIDVDGAFLGLTLHVGRCVESTCREGLDQGLHLVGLGQLRGVLIGDLGTDGLRQLRELLPGQLALEGAKAVNQPLVDCILVHKVVPVLANRVTVLKVHRMSSVSSLSPIILEL